MSKINGYAYDGGTIEVSVEGVGKFSGIESINYGFSKEITKVKGAGKRYVGRTPGILSADDGSMEIWLAEFHNWQEAAGGVAKLLEESNFDITVSYRLEGQPLVTVVLKDCTVINVSSAHSFGGPDNLTVTVNFSVLDIEQKN